MAGGWDIMGYPNSSLRLISRISKILALRIDKKGYRVYKIIAFGKVSTKISLNVY
jgi:hypothetical protein